MTGERQEFDEWFDANFYTCDPVARSTIRAAFYEGKRRGEKAGRESQRDLSSTKLVHETE